LITVAEAAQELGISSRAVLKRIRAGHMRGIQVTARLWLVHSDEVRDWKQKGRMKPGPKKPRATTPTERGTTEG